METKHPQFTPGPWLEQGTAGHDKHGQSVVYPESGDRGSDICIVYDGEANAKLISTAPMGYELAQLVVNSVYPDDPACTKMLEVARAILSAVQD